MAQRAARGQPQAQGTQAAPRPLGEGQSVYVDAMEWDRVRIVGVEAAASRAMAQVDFVGLLGELGFTGPQRSATLGSIIGRIVALDPSRRPTPCWASEALLGSCWGRTSRR
jgi:hypothetical protein